MIDLRTDLPALAGYVVDRYRHLSPPASAGLQARMGFIPEQRVPADDRQVHAWLDTPPDRLSADEARDRGRGALLGLASGDAVGTTLEFQPRDAGQVNDMVGGGPFRLAPGEWTDDTSMALCLADALIEDGAYQPRTFARLLVGWYRQGLNSVRGYCFDIGTATRTALEGQEAAHDAPWQGNTSEQTAGNGSIIRLAPLAIATRASMRATWRLSEGQSRVTHNAAEALAGCQLLGMLLNRALRGGSKEQVLAPHVASLPPRLQIINAGEYKNKRRDQIRSSGYVVDTLEAALWSVWHGRGFEEAVLLAANLGDDADSVACVAGQLAGALYGQAGIPAGWLAKLAWHDEIIRRADALLALNLHQGV